MRTVLDIPRNESGLVDKYAAVKVLAQGILQELSGDASGTHDASTTHWIQQFRHPAGKP